MSTTITITGHGSIINFEVEMINRLLIDLGYKVTLKNPHPFVANDLDDSTIKTLEDFLEYRKSLLKEKSVLNEIILEAKHLPWGG